MENQTSKKILERIRKMMQKAESAKEIGSVAEAEIFSKKVQELLQKYNLSKSDITLEQAEKEVEHEEMGSRVKGMSGMHLGYNIMHQICIHNWCQAYTYRRERKNPTMIVVGSPENVEVCKYIYSIVSRAFKEEAARSYKENKDSILESRLVYMREFIQGAAIGLGAKLKAEKERLQKENKNSSALMVINDQAITNYIEQKWGGTARGRSTSYQRSNSARGKGYEFGKNVKINKGVGASKPISRKMLN